MKIQKLDHSQIDECSLLFMDVFSREPWNEQYESEEEVRNYFLNFLSFDNCLGFVGLENERIIAVCIGMRKPWLKGIEYYIDQFYVASEYQRSGIGSFFLSEIEQYIESIGMKGILLNTEKGYPSYSFYRKNGFTEIDDLRVLGKQ